MTDPPFDFGIFLDSLNNKITEHINFSEKLGYCFWWGLRNLRFVYLYIFYVHTIKFLIWKKNFDSFFVLSA